MDHLPLRGKRVLVTGATAGIGLATAMAVAAAGASDVYILGRREERLERSAQEIASEHAAAVHPVALDVQDQGAIQAVAKQRKDVFDVDVLVNNAGLARGTDRLQDADPGDWDEMVDTNVKGLLYITRQCLPRLIKRKGHVINLGSVAGRWVYPGGAVYCATKSAVGAITEGLRYDLQGTGVRVTNVEPGLVETEFSEVRFKGDTERAAKVYADADVLRAEDVAETIVWCLSRPAHVNVQELVLYPTCQAGVRDVVRNA